MRIILAEESDNVWSEKLLREKYIIQGHTMMRTRIPGAERAVNVQLT